MVPRLFFRSSRVMPTPVSLMLRMRRSLSNLMVILRSVSSPSPSWVLSAGQAGASVRIASFCWGYLAASEALGSLCMRLGPDGAETAGTCLQGCWPPCLSPRAVSSSNARLPLMILGHHGAGPTKTLVALGVGWVCLL